VYYYRIKSFLGKYPSSLGVIAAFFAVGAVGGLAVYAFERRADYLTIFYFVLLVPTALSSLFIAIVAWKWLAKQWDKREVIFVEPLASPEDMARLRNDIVSSCRKLTTDVYCTSHCNLFHDPGLPPEAAQSDKQHLIGLNRQFFRSLAMLTVEARPGLKLLLYYPTEQAFDDELTVRIDVYLEVSAAKKVNLDRSNFDPRHLLQESLHDYFVFEDHVFMTLRKASGGKTEYMHFHSAAVAEHYRAWLEDLFDNGQDNTPPRVEENAFRVKYEALAARLRGERERTKVQSK
jgi:hypothetical protein